MSSNNSNSKMTVCCIYGIIVLLLMGAHAVALGQAKTKASKDTDFERYLLEQFEQDLAVARDQLAYEQYQKRGSEISPWMKDAALPSPDNAALLYYQAFLLQPDLDLSTSHKIDDVLRGAKADIQLRTYLGHCLPAIEMAEIASRIPQCTWGVRYLQIPGYNKSFLSTRLYHLVIILLADARTLAADGNYRAALARCLTVRRFARHIGEEPKLELLSRGHNSMTLRTVQHVLGIMPPDVDILTWFRGQLAVVKGPPLSYAEILQANFKAYLNHVRTNPDPLKYMNKELVEKAKNEHEKENARNLTDEQILSRAFKPFPHFFDSIFRILDSEMTYEQKCAEMQRLIDKLKKEEGTDPLVAHIINYSDIDVILEPPSRQYQFYVGRQAHINGIKAAVEVYLIVAKTGQLPKALPDGLPKDPFTGRDFIYEITDEGFALRCQDEEFLRRKNKWLEFKVKSKD